MIGQHRRQMAARRPAANGDPVAAKAQAPGVIAEPAQRAAGLFGHARQRRLGGQRVTDDGDIETGGQRPCAAKANMSLSLRSQ